MEIDDEKKTDKRSVSSKIKINHKNKSVIDTATEIMK